MAPVCILSLRTERARACVGVFDTGANVSAISTALAQNLGLTISGRRETVTYNGSREAPYSLVSFVLEEGGKRRKFDVYATWADGLPEDMVIMGRDIMCQGQFTINGDGFMFRVEPDSVLR